jgi:hypothetical protein
VRLFIGLNWIRIELEVGICNKFPLKTGKNLNGRATVNFSRRSLLYGIV